MVRDENNIFIFSAALVFRNTSNIRNFARVERRVFTNIYYWRITTCADTMVAFGFCSRFHLCHHRKFWLCFNLLLETTLLYVLLPFLGAAFAIAAATGFILSRNIFLLRDTSTPKQIDRRFMIVEVLFALAIGAVSYVLVQVVRERFISSNEYLWLHAAIITALFILQFLCSELQLPYFLNMFKNPL